MTNKLPVISIIGSGYVGKIVGDGFHDLGHKVIYYDIDKEKGITDLRYAIENSDISFVCVPTPYTNGFDNSAVVSVITKMSAILKTKKEYHLIVIKSTVIPTTTEKIIIPILANTTQLGSLVGVCMNPDFSTESTYTWTEDSKYTCNFFTTDKIIIGEYDTKSGDILESLYKPLDIQIFRVSLTTAEVIKYAQNCIAATRISYWNELFLICKNIEVNSKIVADILGLDPRIGKYGTIHGKAFGGKCLPKDLKSFIDFAEKYRTPSLLKAVDQINEEMLQLYGVRE